MHTSIHVTFAEESARARTERHAGGRGPLAGLRARLHRAAAAPGVPSRAAPGTDAFPLGRPTAASSLRGR
jgi:hypothetical protein